MFGLSLSVCLCLSSMNAEIDIGQIEGAFIMGMGYNFTESLKYDKTTGRNLTDSTWVFVLSSLASPSLWPT